MRVEVFSKMHELNFDKKIAFICGFTKMQHLNNKNKTLAKLEKNRGKSKKDDKKRIDLERDIDERSKKLEEYTNHNLKKSVLEQNRRFV